MKATHLRQYIIEPTCTYTLIDQSTNESIGIIGFGLRGIDK